MEKERAKHKWLAKIIVKYAVSCEEVDPRQRELVQEVAREQKKALTERFRRKFANLWHSSDNLKNEVRTLLEGKTHSKISEENKDNCNANEANDDESNVSGNNPSGRELPDNDVTTCKANEGGSFDDPGGNLSVPQHPVETCDTPLPRMAIAETGISERNRADVLSIVSADSSAVEVASNRCENIESNSTFLEYPLGTCDTVSAVIEDTSISESDRQNCYEEGNDESVASVSPISDREPVAITYVESETNSYDKAVAAYVDANFSYQFSDGEDATVEDTNSTPKSLESPVESSKVKSRAVNPRKRLDYKVDQGKTDPFSAIFKDSNGFVNDDRVRDGIRAIFAAPFEGTCGLSFGTIRLNQNNEKVVYAKCVSPTHEQHFKFTIINLDKLVATVHLLTTEDEIHVAHEGKMFIPLRGRARTEVKQILKYRQPRDYQLEVASSIDPQLAADGNMQDLKTLTVYEKASSEENCKNDLVLQRGDLSDLFELARVQQSKKDPYLRSVGLPLTAIMFTEAQFRLIEYYSGKLIWHLDATGSVVRKPANLDCKRIYYYVIVMKFLESILPLAEMITSEHDIRSIATFLKAVRFFIQEKFRRWPFVAVVVVDWSWAFMNALFREWNDMSAGDYLNMAWSYVNDGKIPHKVVIVQSCCAHFMKRISTIIKKDFSKYVGVKFFLLECVALMMLCRTIEELDKVFENFVKVVSTPDEDDARGNLVALGKIVKDRQVVVADPDEDDSVRDSEKASEPHMDRATQVKSKVIFKNSPFFHHFEEKRLKAESTIDRTKSATNKFYVPGFSRHMTWKHLPFAPLWTSLMLNLVDKDISRLSNAYVESYNKVIKHQVLNHQKNLQIGHFVRKTEEYTEQLVKEAKLGVNVKTKYPTEKPKYPKTIEKTIVRSTIPEDCSEQDPKIGNFVPKTEDRTEQLVEEANRGVTRKTKQPAKKPTNNHAKRKIHPQRKKQKSRNSEIETIPDEASDPLAREIWLDGKIAARAKGNNKGYCEGNALVKIANEEEAKYHKEREEMDESVFGEVEEIEESENKSLDCDSTKIIDPVGSNSYVIANSEDSPKRVMENGLVDNIDYYMRSRSHNIAIGSYTAANNPPIRSNCFTITARQFHTLRAPRWIDGLAIDCYSMTHIDTWTKSLYMSTDDTGVAIGCFTSTRTPRSASIFNITRTLSGRIFMPYMNLGHWRLLLVDLDENALSLLDPYGGNDDEARVREAFEQFLRSCRISSTMRELHRRQWTMKEIGNRPLQARYDGTNCGAYVAYYVECLARNEPFDLSFDPLKFREKMARTLLQKSVCVTEKCLYCFTERPESHRTVCIGCDRWFHADCAYKGEILTDEEELANDPYTRFRKRTKANHSDRGKKFKTSLTNEPLVIHRHRCKFCTRNIEGEDVPF